MSLALIHTIGHSNRSAATLLEHLHRHDIRLLFDIRAFPRSRRFPHFDRAALEGTLAGQDIAYRWAGDHLGGFRKPRTDSRHSALTDAAFRGFADHMETAEFRSAIDQLLEFATRTATVIMCAEADYRHCHRQFVADYLQRRKVEIRHITSDGFLRPHRINPCLNDAVEPAVYNKHEQGDLFTNVQSLP